MRHALSTLSLIAALLCGLISTASSEDYEVKLVRLAKVGERYGIVATGSQEQHMTMTLNGQGMPPRDKVMQVAFTAKAEVLAVSAGGREVKTSFTVETLTNTVGAQATDVLPAGTVVVAERTGAKTEFQVAGAPAKPEVADVLKVVISLESDQGANDDAIFGTKERKKAGDSWPMDAKAGAADLEAKENIKVDPANISGTTTLIEVLPAGMRIAAKVTMKDVAVPLPPGMAVTSSVIAAEFSSVLPIDTSKRVARSSISMDCKVKCAGKVGDKDMTMDLTMKNGKSVTFTAP
jgi:hypothetical protein